jgi:pimeloyl-ACP methyl ester carboxylesterase
MTTENPTDPAAPDTIVLIHGLWVTPRSWEKWVEHYEGKGYRVLTPAYPGLEVEVEALNEDPSPIEALTIPRVVEHYEGIIGELDKPPIIMGHSMGGLIVQILLDHGYGAAGVAIDSAAPEGVRRVPLAQTRAAFPVLRNPANRHKAVGFTPEQFHYGFANTLSREDSDKVYERYHVPAPGSFIWAAVLANFTPGHQEGYVNYQNDERAPLLLIAGGEDHLQPAAVSESNFKHYRHSSATTDYKKFEGRSHYTMGQDGWEEVADYALEWAEEKATTPSRYTGGVQPMETHPAVRPFRVDVPEEDLLDLRRRIAATRWPSKELVDDRSQGVQLATIQELARYWTADYDWRKAEAKLNALPQFKTEIDGVDIHFIHVKSDHEDALALIMTHGWPGSVVELLEVVGPLADPSAHGASAEEAFDLVLPSLPGYGFSGEPTEVGWHPGRTARAWAELMERLGYTRYVAQGGDVGAFVTDAMGRQAPEGLVGIHMNLLVTTLAGGAPPPGDSEEERAALDAIATFRRSGFGYFIEQSTRPQTIGYALLDSPVALAAWMLDHDTDSYYKISGAFLEGQPSGNLTREHVLDNVTLYWLTGTGASAGRAYWESGRAQALAGGQAPPEVSLPVGFTVFPGEIFRAPRSWVERGYPSLVYFNEVDRGGHFAAWEEPELFATEVRQAFRSLR